MIRPTSLLRSDSDRPQFTTPVVAIKKESIDCGIVNLIPCCLPPWCHRFATPRCFLSSLIKLAIIQGALQAYVAITLSSVQRFFDFPHTLIEWVAVSHDLFMGIFGLLVAHFGFRYHRPVWIGALACFQGLASIVITFPYNEYMKIHAGSAMVNMTSPNLCNEQAFKTTNLELVMDEDSNAQITLGIFFALQLLTGLANASFYAHGFSYLDDNIEKHMTPVYLCVLIAVRMCSYQVGLFMAWYFVGTDKSWSGGYYLIGGILLKCGILIIMFPRYLLPVIMKRTVDNIVENARTGSTEDVERDSVDEKHVGFFSSLMRVVTNKIIVINTFSSVLMYMALDNFAYYEGKFMEAKYYLPNIGEGWDDPWTSRLVKNIVRTPTTALCIIISGLVIGKFQPKPRKLALWNVIVSVIVATTFVSFIFINCEKDQIVGEYKNHLISPYCSRKCNCDATSTKFEPVCTQDGKQTFYSPCHAGCKQISYINNIKFYSNCTCSVFDPRFTESDALATPGACNSDSCAKSWMIFQTLSIICSALIATGFMGNLLITLRSVIPSDKSMAVAFELALAGILVHVPGKNIFAAVAGSTCQYISNDGATCSLHNPNFGKYVSILCACLLLLSAVMDAILVLFVKDLKLYDDNDNGNDNQTPLRIIDSSHNVSRSNNPEESRLITTRATVEATPRNISSSSSERPESDPPRYSDIETRRPRRPSRPTRQSRVTSSDDEPLSDRTGSISPVRRSMTPRSQDGMPMGNEEAQRHLINQLRQSDKGGPVSPTIRSMTPRSQDGNDETQRHLINQLRQSDRAGQSSPIIRAMTPRSQDSVPFDNVEAQRRSINEQRQSNRSDVPSPIRKSMTPRSQDGFPMENEEAQRDLINEFRLKQGSLV